MKQSNNKDAEQSQSNAITLRVIAVANEPAALKLHEGEYGRASERERSRANTMMVSRAKQRNTSVVNEPAAIKLHLGDSARQRICPCARSNKAARDRVRQNSARSLRTNVPGSRSRCVLSRSDCAAASSSAGMSPSPHPRNKNRMHTHSASVTPTAGCTHVRSVRTPGHQDRILGHTGCHL